MGRICCACNDFVSLFFGQLFDIGGSAGSIFIEAINLFRIFQRLSATKSFTAKWTNFCTAYFKVTITLVVNGRAWCPPPTLKSPSRCSGTAPLRLKPPLRATPRAPAPGPRINLANNIYRTT